MTAAAPTEIGRTPTETGHKAPPSPQRTSPAATIGWIVFVLLVVYAVLIGGGWAGIYLAQLRAITLALVAVALLAWLLVSLRAPHWRPSTSIWPTLVVPPVVLALATLASSTPRLGHEYVAWAVLLVGLYLLLVRILATHTARDRIGALAAMLTLVIGLLYVGQVVVRWFEWWGLVGELAVPPLRPLYAGLSLGGPGTVAAVQVLTAVVALAGLGLDDRRRQLMAAALVVLTAVVVVLAASRASWVALAGAAVVTGGIWLIVAVRSGSLRASLRQRWPRRSPHLVGAMALGIGAGILVAAPVVVSRLSGSGDGGRPAYFAAALRMFEDAPLLGLGPGTWAVRRAAYTDAAEFDWYIPHAHNVYLHTLAELGLVGLLAGALVLLPVAWLLIRALRGGAPERRRWAWAGVFILVFLALFQLFDFHMNVPAEMALAAIPIAWLDATSSSGLGIGRRSEAAARFVGQTARVVLVIACVVAIVVLVRAESVARTHDEAVSAVYAADWEIASEPAQDAATTDPDMPPYQITLGLVASAQLDWPVAAAAYERAARADDMPTSLLGLAQAQLALGADPDRVMASLERATRLGKQQPSVLFAAGALYDRLGLTDQADAAYAATIAEVPSLAADPAWGADDLAARFPGIVESAMALAHDQAWEIALMTGDAIRAANLAEAGPPYANLVIDAWQGDAEARDALDALADANPDDGRLLSWASRLAARHGDTKQAERYQRLAVYVVTEGGDLPGTEIRIDPIGWLEAVPAGSRTGYAGHYLYRRPLSRDLLPPGLPRLIHE